MRAKGFQGTIANRKGATWGTAVAGGAGHGVYGLALATPGNTQLVEQKSLTGKITRRPSLLGNRIVDVTLKVELTYEGLETTLALLWGTAGVPSVVDTSARLHPLKLKDDLDGIFSTVAYELLKDTQVVEIPSVKWFRATLRAKSGEAIELEMQGIGFDYVTDSVINTTTTIDTVTYPSNREVAMFGHSAWEMNAQGGAGLGSSPLYTVGWEVTVERAFDRRISTRFGTKTSEPVPNGFAKVSGTWEFEILEDGTGGNASLMADQIAGNAKKATCTITGTTLAGAATQKFQHKLWFPHILLGEGKPDISDAGAVVWSQPWESFHVLTIPTGFTAGYLDACTYEIYSQKTTDALA